MKVEYCEYTKTQRLDEESPEFYIPEFDVDKEEFLNFIKYALSEDKIIVLIPRKE